MHERSSHLRVKVECYEGYRADERPQRFYIQKRCVEVEDIIDQWVGPDYRYFKLKGDDGGIYILRHTESGDFWELTLYDSGQHEETRLSST